MSASDRLFFYSGSADRAPGQGVHEQVADPQVYETLRHMPDWRKMLSNFWVAEFRSDGVTYRTVEHAFQASKIALVDPTLARQFSIESGSTIGQGDGLVARKNRKLVLLSDEQLRRWDREKHAIMQSALRAKFGQHATLRTALLSTGTAQLWHGAGRGAKPERMWDLEAIRAELAEEPLFQADIVFRFEGRAVAGLLLDPVQDKFPWYEGTLTKGPNFSLVGEFLARFCEAQLEHDFAPYHPDEQAYENTDLFSYVETIATFRRERVTGDEDPWLVPWRNATDVELDRYLEFLDWRRWHAVHSAGVIERGIALPPCLDFGSKRFAYRPW